MGKSQLFPSRENLGDFVLLETMNKMSEKIRRGLGWVVGPKRLGCFFLFTRRFCFAVADIPGLIEGAHSNKGLGHAFLRHIERCSCLAYVVDLSDDPLYHIEQLKKELELYQAGLSTRPSAIVANKIDLVEDIETITREIREKTSLPVYPVSGLKRENISTIKHELRKLYRETKRAQKVVQAADKIPDRTESFKEIRAAFRRPSLFEPENPE